MGNIPFKRFGIMLDMSRNGVMSLEGLKTFVDRIAPMGYNTILLYIEDTYEIPGEPYFGHQRGRYSQDEIRQIVAYCEKKGVEVIPCIQTLAHLNCMFKWMCYKKINDTKDILLAENEESYALIRKMLQSVKDTFKTNQVHIGMDEAHLLGLGKYLDQNGYRDRFQILSRHLQVVCDMAKEMGLEPNIWSDMFFRLGQGQYYSDKPYLPMDQIGTLPENVSLTYWDYYTTRKKRLAAMIRAHKKFDRPIWFAGGVWTWKGFAPDNRYSVRATRAAMEVAAHEGVENFFVCSWQAVACICPRASILPALYASAQIAKGETDMKKIKEGFEKEFDIPYNHFIDLDLAENRTGTEAGDCAWSPERYLLYNDPFCGKFDSTLVGGEAAFYKKFASKLARHANHQTFGPLFAAQRDLARALSYKADLGVRARKAYQAGDKEEMEKIAKDFAMARRYVLAFLKSYRVVWFQENKPQGLEVEELRLGGLAERLKACRERILDWIENDTPIEELNEVILDFHGGGENLKPGHMYQVGWAKLFTVGRD